MQGQRAEGRGQRSGAEGGRSRVRGQRAEDRGLEEEDSGAEGRVLQRQPRRSPSVSLRPLQQGSNDNSASSFPSSPACPPPLWLQVACPVCAP